MAKKLTPAKAKEILHDKSVHGHPLTDKQRKFFGAMSNMNEGGWLDNYNDSQASAPEGMKGDGFSNVGRNYSPAWGGQFQNGGKALLYVESKNDPRYKAYQDSLSLYKRGKEKKLFWKNNPNATNEELNKKELEIEKKNPISKNRDAFGTNIIESIAMEQIGRGSGTRGIPQYKKPQQQVIVKDQNAPQYKTIHTGEGEGRFEPTQRQSIHAVQNNLQPAGLVQGDLDMDAAEIHPEVRRAKSWKYNTREGRSEESGYINSPEDMDYYTRLKDFYQTGAGKGLGNKVEITPKYQMGGYVYPVNYVPQAQMGSSIPGAVGFSYARTQGAAPSNGKYAKKTMASAQNGKEMQYYQNGLDWQPKTISKNGSWLSKYDEGGIIKDDRGQWDHPDEPTRISGGNITMKPDPLTGKPLTEPILGIADTGEEQMMYPGEDYNFKGAEYVDEYPKGKRPKKAQNGLRQEQKGLQNLDNLTNFTNYNKPQPGGWLNKYN